MSPCEAKIQMTESRCAIAEAQSAAAQWTGGHIWVRTSIFFRLKFAGGRTMAATAP